MSPGLWIIPCKTVLDLLLSRFLWFPMGHFGFQISPGRELKGMYWQCDSEQDPEKKNRVPEFLCFQLQGNNSAVAVRML